MDLARLAGLIPAGVVCEIMNDDGTMARVADLTAFCERHGIKMVTVADLIEHRRRNGASSARRRGQAAGPNYGEFEAVAYREVLTGKHHAPLKGEVDGAEDVLVRVHSSA